MANHLQRHHEYLMPPACRSPKLRRRAVGPNACRNTSLRSYTLRRILPPPFRRVNEPGNLRRGTSATVTSMFMRPAGKTWTTDMPYWLPVQTTQPLASQRLLRKPDINDYPGGPILSDATIAAKSALNTISTMSTRGFQDVLL